MRAGLVRNVGVGMLALGALALGACDDNPIDFDEKDGVRFRTNPSSMVIPAGRTAELDVAVLNQGAEPTYDPVDAEAAQCDGPASVTVAEDPDQTSVQPPGQLLVTAGTTLGSACVVVSGGGVTDTVDVIVVADGVAVVSAPDTLRAGQTGTVEVRLTSFDGSTVTPFSPQDVAWTTDAANVVDVDDTGGLTTEESGTAAITATWTGTEATGTAGLGVERDASTQVTVIANVPAEAFFDTLVVDEGSFGAFEADEEIEVEVVVVDAFGNQNTDETEITGVTVQSSDETVATVSGELVPSSSVNVIVTVTTVSGGQADISGTVQTTEGDLAFGPATVTVVAPAITAINPPSGAPGTPFTVTGASLSAPGLTPVVTLNGFAAADVQVVSANELLVTPPYFGDAGALDVVVELGGVVSDPATWTEIGGFDAETTEPENDTFESEPIIGFPFDATGVIGGSDFDDLFRVTIPAGGGTLEMTLDWDDPGNDIDIYVNDTSSAPALTIPPIVCFDGGTLGKPETTICSLPEGDHIVWIADFGPGISNYTVTGTFTPAP